MDYALAKQLEDAGFPQGTGHYIDDSGASSLYIAPQFAPKGCMFFPTLEELVYACADNFYSLEKIRDPERYPLGRVKPDDKFAAVSVNALWCSAAEPDVAVAHLWLALNKK